MNYGLIERAPDGTESVLTTSYDSDDMPPYVGQTLNVEDGPEPREMTVVEMAERSEIKPGIVFVILQTV